MHQKDMPHQQINNPVQVDNFIQHNQGLWRGSRRRAIQLLATGTGAVSAMLLPAFARKNPAIAVETKTKTMNNQAIQQLQPNLFELRGYNIEITYSRTSIVGEAQLSYFSPQQQRTFSSEEIQTQATALGQNVTVFFTTGAADEPIESLTLLIPAIQLSSTVKELPIQTLVILSTRAAFVDPNAPLLLQTYDTISLFGTAKFVQS